MREDLERAVRDGAGIVRWSRELRGDLLRATACGAMQRLLPEVYVVPHLAERLETRAAALAQADPDAVITGRAAAALTWWPELRVDVVEAVRRGLPQPVPGFAWSRRVVPLGHVVDLGRGVRATDAALTVLDLLPEVGGIAVDEALRRRVVSLKQLWTTLEDLPPRRGNALRRRLLEDSRHQPWSEAERHFHRLLRQARLPFEFTTNEPVKVGARVVLPDVSIRRLRLAFDVDGFEFHTTRAAFVADRKNDIRLSLAGWVRHRFAADTVLDEPKLVIWQIRELAFQRATDLGMANAAVS